MKDPLTEPADRSHRQYVFGEFTLDLDAGFLRRGSEEVTLRPKAFEILAYLVQHHGRLVSKTTLIESVWRDAAVTDNSLSQSLLEIRRALSDDSQQLIRTVKRRGYMFAAPVRTPVMEFPRNVESAGTQPSPLPAHAPFAGWRSSRLLIAGCIIALLAISAGALLYWRTPPARQEATYEQITNFPDSALAPALSPDGRIVAFYRSDSWFLTPEQIYVKMLPGGEPVQLTHNNQWKYGLAFRRTARALPIQRLRVGRPAGKPTRCPCWAANQPSFCQMPRGSRGWINTGCCSPKSEAANTWAL